MTVVKHIDLQKYRENLVVIMKTMGPARVMAVVKADGYGHGLVETARAASEAGVPILGVLDIESGLELRKAGIQTPAFAWLHSPSSDFQTAVRAGIELSINSIQELENVARVEGVAKVHLKLDSGLSRNGIRPEYWEALVKRAVALDNSDRIDLVAVWTHLSGTSQIDDRDALHVFDAAFEKAVELGFTGYRHVASSPAAFSLPEARYELVRIGVSAFGTSPIENVTAESLGLSCPMTVTAEVIAPETISIGFLHGYFSLLEGKASVAIGENLYRVTKIGPLASKIEAGEYEIGDTVRVFGDSNELAPTAEALCELVETVTDELFTGLKANSVTYTV